MNSISPPAPPPARALLRDPWALASAFAVLVLVARAWSAPLGEPVAQDFGFLQRALFGSLAPLDAGGSIVPWRPIPNALYYLALGRLMLAHPLVIAGLHTTLLACASLLLYRTFRTVRPGPWAAVVATAPILSESTRMLIAWPGGFAEVGAWLFVALAAHETAMRRMPTALLALAGALLCHETAVIAALLVPLMPGVGPRDGRIRSRWFAAFVALAVVWAAVALAVHAHPGAPRSPEAAPLAAAWGERFVWASANSLRAIVSLPLVEGPNDRFVGSLLALIVLLWAARGLRQGRDPARWRRALPWTLWGVAWFLGAMAPLATVFPSWTPSASAFGSLGIVAAATELAAAVHPVLLAGLVAVRLLALGLAPAPPAHITPTPPASGAFMDFERLTRLQRLVRSTRMALRLRLAHPNPGARVASLDLPPDTRDAFAGSGAVRAWYRDPSLGWVPNPSVLGQPESSFAAIVEFEPESTPQAAIVDPAAMHAYLAARARAEAGDLDTAAALLDRADAHQLDDAARTFRGRVAGERALVLLAQGRPDDAAREAARACELFRVNVAGRYVLARTSLLRGDLAAARAHLDSALKWEPGNARLSAVKREVSEAERTGPPGP